MEWGNGGGEWVEVGERNGYWKVLHMILRVVIAISSIFQFM